MTDPRGAMDFEQSLASHGDSFEIAVLKGWAQSTDVVAAWVTYAAAPGVLATAGLEYADDSTTEDFGGIVYMSLLF